MGEFGFDIDLDGTEEVDVLAVRRRNVRQHLIVDAPAPWRREFLGDTS
jgi:hypothetical protein